MKPLKLALLFSLLVLAAWAALGAWLAARVQGGQFLLLAGRAMESRDPQQIAVRQFDIASGEGQ